MKKYLLVIACATIMSASFAQTTTPTTTQITKKQKVEKNVKKLDQNVKQDHSDRKDLKADKTI